MSDRLNDNDIVNRKKAYNVLNAGNVHSQRTIRLICFKCW